jgi:hypothetical protein
MKYWNDRVWAIATALYVAQEPALRFPGALTADRLASQFADDAILRSFESRRSGGGVANVLLQRDRASHEEALNELLLAAQQVGYSFVDGEITSVADRAIETAIAGGVVGGGAGASTQNREAAALGGFLGWVAGLIVGAKLEKVEVLYRVQWTPIGWRLVPVREAAPAMPLVPA